MLATSPPPTPPPATSRPSARKAPSWKLARLSITWNTGACARLRSGRTSSSTRSKGTSWCAYASSVVSRTRPSSSRKLGSPERSVRSASELRKSPTIRSVSARVRPAIGVPTTTSSCPARRPQDHVQRGEEDHEQRGALAAGQRVHLRRQAGRDDQALDRAAVRFHRRPGTVGRQLQERRSARPARCRQNSTCRSSAAPDRRSRCQTA